MPVLCVWWGEGLSILGKRCRRDTSKVSNRLAFIRRWLWKAEFFNSLGEVYGFLLKTVTKITGKNLVC